jgi:hypothetical protein
VLASPAPGLTRKPVYSTALLEDLADATSQVLGSWPGHAGGQDYRAPGRRPPVAQYSSNPPIGPAGSVHLGTAPHPLSRRHGRYGHRARASPTELADRTWPRAQSLEGVSPQDHRVQDRRRVAQVEIALSVEALRSSRQKVARAVDAHRHEGHRAGPVGLVRDYDLWSTRCGTRWKKAPVPPGAPPWPLVAAGQGAYAPGELTSRGRAHDRASADGRQTRRQKRIVDLGFRARVAGRRVLLQPAASVLSACSAAIIMADIINRPQAVTGHITRSFNLTGH